MTKRFLVVILVVAAMLMVTIPLKSDSAEDYKVIKAAKGKKTTDTITWFRVEVKEKGKEKATVKIKIPFALVDLLMDSTKEKLEIDNDIDLRKVVKILREHGPMTIIEVEDDDTTVRVWFE